MHQAPHPCALHGGSNALRQLHVHLLEALLVAMQHRNQVDHGIVPGHELGERGVIERAGFQHGQAWQGLHGAGMVGAARGHRHAVTRAHQ